MLKYLALATLALASPAPAPSQVNWEQNKPAAGTNTRIQLFNPRGGSSPVNPWDGSAHHKSIMRDLGLQISLPNKQTTAAYYYKGTAGGIDAIPTTLYDAHTFYVPDWEWEALAIPNFGGYVGWSTAFSDVRTDFRDSYNNYGTFDMSTDSSTVHTNTATYRLQYLPTWVSTSSAGKTGSTEIMQMIGGTSGTDADFMITVHCNTQAQGDSGLTGAKHLPIAYANYCVIGQGNHLPSTMTNARAFDRYLSYGDQFQVQIYAKGNYVEYSYRRFTGDDGAGYSFTAAKPYIYHNTSPSTAILNPYSFKAGNYCQVKGTMDFYCDIWLYSVEMCHGGVCKGTRYVPSGYSSQYPAKVLLKVGNYPNLYCLVINNVSTYSYTKAFLTTCNTAYNEQKINFYFDEPNRTFDVFGSNNPSINYLVADSSSTVVPYAALYDASYNWQRWQIQSTSSGYQQLYDKGSGKCLAYSTGTNNPVLLPSAACSNDGTSWLFVYL